MKYKKGIQKILLLAFLISVSTLYNCKGIEQVSANETQARKYDINKSAMDSGITFTIHNIVKDGNQLNLEYEMRSENDIPEIEANIANPRGKSVVFVEKPDIYINGQIVDYSGPISHKKVGKHQYKGTIGIKSVENIPENFDMKVNIDYLLEQEGQWTIKFPIKG
jgi:archaellum component FlaF (FlaF/FlaG flagellin family)